MKYTRKTLTVDAVQLKSKTTITTDDGEDIEAESGDWLVEMPNGEQVIMSNDAFEEEYEDAGKVKVNARDLFEPKEPERPVTYVPYDVGVSGASGQFPQQLQYNPQQLQQQQQYPHPIPGQMPYSKEYPAMIESNNPPQQQVAKQQPKKKKGFGLFSKKKKRDAPSEDFKSNNVQIV